jgi:ABC-type glutathione transport system ATPase component
MLLLEVKHLSSSYSARPVASLRRMRKRVLYDITLSLGERETLALLGGSGSGKSTFARCIAGLHEPDGGTILFEGLNIFPHTYNRATTDLSIQMLFQATGSSLNPRRTGLDTLVEAVEASGGSGGVRERQEVAKDLAAEVGLPVDMLLRKPHQISGGQRQRLAIARVLAAGPRLVVLDEPTSALDTITQVRVMTLLHRLQKEHRFSMILITHDVSLALGTGGQVAVLHDGVIVENKSSKDIRMRPEHAYTKQLLVDSRVAPEHTEHPRPQPL